MNNRNKYLLVLLVAVLAVSGYYVLRDYLTEWTYNLQKDKKNAYGTFLTYELLKDNYQRKGFSEINTSVIKSFRKLKKNKTYNYVFINRTPYYDSATVDTLCRFAEAGNTVFISSEELFGSFRDSVLYETYHLKITSGYSILYYKFLDSLIHVNNYSTLNFIHPSLRDSKGYTYYQKYRADTVNYFFLKFEPVDDTDWTRTIPENNSIAFAGYENSYGTGLNFAILKHGKGQFIILLTALPLTNYFMRTEKGLEYASKVFSHLPSQPTLWDNISQEYVPLEHSNSHEHSTYGDSPLYFILQNKQLRWAWYLTIVAVLIYALFAAKRRQNIIPIIEPKVNTSLKYVETIGQLYYHDEEHIEIAMEMRIQFLNYVRQKYFLKTNEINEDFFAQLSAKSTIEPERIKSIFDELHDVEKVKSISQKKLHHLNEQLEYFYKNCK